VPYTTADIANQFLRQFTEEDGALVYRRHGRGPAYRVTDGQTQDYLARYMRRTRIARFALFAATVAFGGGGAWLLAQADPMPSEGVITAWTIGFVAALVALFVWAELRAQTLPHRELSRTAPASPEIDKADWTRHQLKSVPWVNFAIPPIMGLFLVWSLHKEVDLAAGWGRLVWLVPVAFTALAGVQAWRKWKYAAKR